MKKAAKTLLSILLSGTLAAGIPSSAYAASGGGWAEMERPVPYVADLEAPVLESMTLGVSSTIGDSASVTLEPGDTLILSAQATDDVSGVAKVGAVYRTPEGKNWTINLSVDKDAGVNDAGELVYTARAQVELDETMAPGTYRLSSAAVADRFGRQRTYGADKLPDCDFLFVNPDYTPPETDTVKPVLHRVTVGESSAFAQVQAGGAVLIEAEASDDSGKVRSVELQFAEKSETDRKLRATLLPVSGEYLRAQLDVSQYEAGGLFELENAAVTDEAGNVSRYTRSAPGTLDMGVSIEVVNAGDADRQPPVFTDIAFMTAGGNADGIEGDAPFVCTVMVTAEDDVSGLAEARVVFTNANSRETRAYSRTLTKLVHGKPNAVSGEIKISEWEPAGSFELTQLSVKDHAGNWNHYGGSQVGATQKLPKVISFFVNNLSQEDYDLITPIETCSPDKIQNLPDGAKIAVTYKNNATLDASIFEAIRGTNKTLILEGGGIRWEFNGKDIREEDIKPINLGVSVDILSLCASANKDNILKKVGNTPAVLVAFADNGKLPGKAKISLKVNYMFYTLGVKDLSVYYYNSAADALEEVASGLDVTEESYVEFEVSHNSDFIVTKGRVNGSSDSSGSSSSSDSSSEPDDNSSGSDGGSSGTSDGSSSTSGGRDKSSGSGGDWGVSNGGYRYPVKGKATAAGSSVGKTEKNPAGIITLQAVKSWMQTSDSLTLYVSQQLEIERGVFSYLKENPVKKLTLRRSENGKVSAQSVLAGAQIRTVPDAAKINMDLMANPLSTNQLLRKFYSNQAATVSLSKAQDLGLSTEIAIRAGGKVKNASDITVYVYDRGRNTINPVADAKPWIDKNGFIHFYTSAGGEFIVTNGALKK